MSRRHSIEACEASLERLQTDWIDLYQLHRAQSDVPIDETLRALDDLIRAGKIRYIGTSMFPSWKIVEALWAAKEFGLNRFVCEQMAYNLLDRTAEREVLPAARSFGIATDPVGAALRRSAHRQVQARRPERGRPLARRQGQLRPQGDARGVRRDRGPSVALADEKGCSPSQLALAWLRAQPGVTAPIIGPRTLEQARRQPRRGDGADHRRRTAHGSTRSRRRCHATLRYYDAAMAIDFKPNLVRW